MKPQSKRRIKYDVRLTAARFKGNPCRICGNKIKYKYNYACVVCLYKRLKARPAATVKAASAKRQKHLRIRIKDAVIAKYGGKCACKKCPENKNPHRRFLTMDHETPVGAAREDNYNMHKRLYYSEELLPGFRVLCFNCNCGRYINGGLCPHEED